MRAGEHLTGIARHHGVTIAAIAGANGASGALKSPQPVDKGRQIERPAAGITQAGSGYARVGEVFRDPKTGKLVLIEPAPGARAD